jgi:hypothetical protein
VRHEVSPLCCECGCGSAMQPDDLSPHGTVDRVQQISEPEAQEIARAIAKVPALYGVYHSALEAPAAGSRAERLLGDELGARSYHIAASCLVSALDHVSTMKRIYESGEVPAYALFSLARSAHESALVAEWLMEPTLDDDGQIARGVGAQYDDYSERAKLDTAVNAQPKGDGQLAVDRRATFMTKALARDFARLNSRGDLIPTRPMPTIVDLFDSFESRSVQRRGEAVVIPGSSDYRLYSAFAHGKQWANLLGQLAPIAERDAHGHSMASFTASDSALARAFVGPVTAIRRALHGVVTHRELTE